MNAAIFGLGVQGKRILEVLNRTQGINLTSLIDSNPEVFKSIRNLNGAQTYESFDRFSQESSAELVCIATHCPSHAEIAIRCIESGAKYVLVEKPMACSISDCEKMINFAEKNDARLVVNQSRRYDSTYVWLRKKIISGIWGELKSIWIQRPGIGLGCIGTHSFDLARFLTNHEVREVTAWIDEPNSRNPRGEQFVDPGGLVVLNMEGKFRIIISQIEDGSGPRFIEINMSKARIHIDEKLDRLEVVSRNSVREESELLIGSYHRLKLPNNLSAQVDLEEMLEGLISDLISESPKDCNAVDGKIAIEILVASYLSNLNNHSPISLSSMSDKDKKLFLPIT